MARFFVFLTTMMVLALVVAGAAFGYGLYAYVKPNTALTEPKLVVIQQGASMRQIAEDLEDNGVIENPYVFLIAAKIQNASLQAGEFQFQPQSTPAEVITLLRSGKTYQRKITFAEGLTVHDIAAILNADPVLTGTIDALPPEGSLLPDTYNYTYGDTRAGLMKRMQDAHTTLIADLWARRVQGLPLRSPEEAVTLASIVEKETGITAERSRVAGVFINRLNEGMLLQTDPTVIYAMTLGRQKLDRPLLFKDLEIDSPYNTYKYPGLPPQPIANPGRASLEAVLLTPESHDLLFFVADGTGGHVFAKTLAEHNANVANWRKINRQQMLQQKALQAPATPSPAPAQVPAP